MQRFFEQKADSLWPATTPPVHKVHELAARSNIESPALPAAAAGRRLSSFFEVMNLVKGKWCPATGSNESRSPSTNSSSSADSMNSFDSSAVLTHQDSDDFQLQSPIEAYPAILFPVVDQRRSLLPMDEALLKPQDASSLKVTPDRKKQSSMSDESKSIGALPRVQKRKRTDPTLSALEESNSPTSKLFMPIQPMLKASAKKNQKLGDKVTALQQLVSPFGKTDTASVLHEATVYIKALHEQINSLSKPYLESIYSEGIQGTNMRHGERCSSLRAIGLCMVPTSSAVLIFGG